MVNVGEHWESLEDRSQERKKPVVDRTCIGGLVALLMVRWWEAGVAEGRGQLGRSAGAGERFPARKEDRGTWRRASASLGLSGWITTALAR